MTPDDTETDRDEAGSHAHHAPDHDSVAFGVLTVSSSRTLETDKSGDALAEALEANGHAVHTRDLVADDVDAIRESVRTLLDDGVDAVVTTGGTGLTADDVTPDALEPLFDREIPGFGEQFRAQSVDQVGPHGMLTRATAGLVEDTPVFCLPGSEDAADFGASELVAPVVGHVVGLADQHHHGDSTGDESHQHAHDEHEEQQ
jgi:molybdenum cofactor biosynthesis protein B